VRRITQNCNNLIAIPRYCMPVSVQQEVIDNDVHDGALMYGNYMLCIPLWRGCQMLTCYLWPHRATWCWSRYSVSDTLEMWDDEPNWSSKPSDWLTSVGAERCNTVGVFSTEVRTYNTAAQWTSLAKLSGANINAATWRCLSLDARTVLTHRSVACSQSVVTKLKCELFTMHSTVLI